MEKEVITVVKDNINDYVLQAILAINSGVPVIEIVGRGKNIYKAVYVFNRLRGRIGDAVEIERVEIGSEERGRRRIPYIKIVLKQKLPL
ncbi:DNA-binding protein [Ignicoccus islandicus DSM 13165]|uniref:DNA-binding protein n=1 Tax=Ignicoccus islandicus DSM 13165 TaxID=940295 RepID=A0A0U3FZ20_9CREN|nr:hypothetical protein [Ignicoccus islandicus]ALU11340.1 DNA-binding protein [Ignicoccus islandicus DSM 13165]